LLALREEQRTEKQWQAPQEVKAAAAVGSPAQPVQARPVRRRWKSVALAGLLTIGLLAAGIRLIRLYPISTATNNPAPTPVPAAAPPGLGLRFHHQGADLFVTWDREAVVRSGAGAGLLSIRDGAVEKAIGLNLDQLLSANVLLAPKGDQVQLQLTLVLPNQRTLSESGLAILSSGGQADRFVPTVAAPARQVTPEQISQLVSKPLAERSFTPLPVQATAAPPALDDPPSPTPGTVSLGWVSSIHFPLATPAAPSQPVAPDAVRPAGAPSGTSSGPSSAEAEPRAVNVRPAEFVGGKNPLFPPAAHDLRVQGTVVVEALITPEGRVKQVKVVSGHPLLQDAAARAVSTWSFKPALINGKPVEAPARVEVKFRGNW
jgi:TonB family protein